MRTVCQQRKQEKARLLAQIQQQRLDLSDECAAWPPLAIGDYRRSKALKYLLISCSVLSLYRIARRPRRLIRYTRRVITLWEGFKLLRRLFYR